jgi:hypothetical protein
MQVRRFLSVPHVERHGAEVALLIALAAVLVSRLGAPPRASSSRQPTSSAWCSSAPLRTMGERRIAQAERKAA